MAIQTPGVGVVAQPTGGTYVRPAANTAQQLAAALGDLNPALNSAANVFTDHYIARQREEGKKRAIEDAATWQVKSIKGEVELGENPWFERAYKEQLGRNTGRQLQEEATAAYETWEGKDSGNETMFQEFLGNFIRERTKDINDHAVIDGMLPEIDILTNNLSIANAQYQAKRIESEATDAIYSGVADSLDTAAGLDEEHRLPSVFANYENMKDRFHAAGVPRGRFDDVYANSVIDYAIANLDEGSLAILEKARADAPAISKKAGMLEKIANARYTIESRAAAAEMRAAQMTKAQAEANARQLFSDYGRELVETGTVSKEMQKRVALFGVTDPEGIKEFKELKDAWHSANADLDEPLDPQDIRDVPINLQIEILDKGNVQALIRAQRSGLIHDPKLFSELLRQAVGRREGEQGQAISREGLELRKKDSTSARLGTIKRRIQSDTLNINGPRGAWEGSGPEAANELDDLIDSYVNGDPGAVSESEINRLFGFGYADTLNSIRDDAKKK